MTNKLQIARTSPEDKAFSLGGIDSYVWTPGLQSVQMPMTGTKNTLEAVLAEQFQGTEFSLRCRESDRLSWIEVEFNAAADVQDKAVSIAAIFNGTDIANGERTHVLKQIGLHLIDWNVDTVLVNKISAESHRAEEIVTTTPIIESVNQKARQAAPHAFMRKLQANFT